MSLGKNGSASIALGALPAISHCHLETMKGEILL